MSVVCLLDAVANGVKVHLKGDVANSVVQRDIEVVHVLRKSRGSALDPAHPSKIRFELTSVMC